MEFFYFLGIMLLLCQKFILAEANEVDYCGLCKKPGTHTLCERKYKVKSESCTGVTNALLSLQDREEIVALHNGWRNIVALGISTMSKTNRQPPAANMEEMVWSDELANSAQRWANQCVSFQKNNQHDECRMKNDGTDVGQNIGTSISYEIDSRSDLSDTIFSWMKESYSVTEKDINSFQVKPNSLMGHYSQLVWAESREIGCGRVIFREFVTSQIWTIDRLVCNYSPEGNTIGHNIYNRGKACSSCPDGTKCNSLYKGLCSADAQSLGRKDRRTLIHSFLSRYESRQVLSYTVKLKNNHFISLVMFLCAVL